jgi:4-carboxymuconolactone decarboxylase
MRKSKRYLEGWSKLVKMRGEEHAKKLLKPIEELCPDLAKFSLEFVMADIWTRKVFDYKMRELITIAILAAMGGRDRHVKDHIRAALQNGVSKEEILEVMIQLAVYAGFPAAISGVFALKEVLEEGTFRS